MQGINKRTKKKTVCGEKPQTVRKEMKAGKARSFILACFEDQ